MSIKQWASRNGWEYSVRSWMMDLMGVTLRKGAAAFQVVLPVRQLDKSLSGEALEELGRKASEAEGRASQLAV